MLSEINDHHQWTHKLCHFCGQFSTSACLYTFLAEHLRVFTNCLRCPLTDDGRPGQAVGQATQCHCQEVNLYLRVRGMQGKVLWGRLSSVRLGQLWKSQHKTGWAGQEPIACPARLAKPQLVSSLLAVGALIRCTSQWFCCSNHVDNDPAFIKHPCTAKRVHSIKTTRAELNYGFFINKHSNWGCCWLSEPSPSGIVIKYTAF